MAFSPANKIKICKVLDITMIRLDAQLVAYAAYMTSDAETSVLADLAEWDSFIANSHIEIEANSENFGASIKFADKLETIKNGIARTLMFETSDLSSGFRLFRG